MGTTLLLLAGMIAAVIAVMAVGLIFLFKLIIKSAPEDVQEFFADRPDPPVWKTVVGVILMAGIFAGVGWILYYAGKDAKTKHMNFRQIFLRYMTLLEGYKLFDIVFIDWLMISKIQIMKYLYPETKELKGHDSFGFNRKSQMIKMGLFAVISAVIAAILAEKKKD